MASSRDVCNKTALGPLQYLLQLVDRAKTGCLGMKCVEQNRHLDNSDESLGEKPRETEKLKGL